MLLVVCKVSTWVKSKMVYLAYGPSSNKCLILLEPVIGK
jgi:hypothetical protein